MLLEHIDYPSLLLRPNAMPAEGKLIMNYAGQGHVDLFTFFSQLTGFGPLTRGLAAAKAVLASGGRAVYLTLTNDHQPRTQREHDLTLGWDRTLKDTSSMRFIGPPGRFTEEGVRKREFCMMSERLVRRHGNDSSLRFSLPCATPGLPGGVAAYAELLETEARTPLNAAGQGKGPLWITRRLRSHGVCGARLCHGVCGARLRHGACGARLRSCHREQKARGGGKAREARKGELLQWFSWRR